MIPTTSGRPRSTKPIERSRTTPTSVRSSIRLATGLWWRSGLNEAVRGFGRVMGRGGPRALRLSPPEEPERKAKPGTFRRIVHTFKPYRRKVTLVGVLILITSGLGVINPLLIKLVFNIILGTG